MHTCFENLRSTPLDPSAMTLCSNLSGYEVAAIDPDRLALLTHGLDDWTEEGSGFADGNELLTGHGEEPCINSAVAIEHRNFILYTHNRLRSKLAQGRQPNKEGMMGSGKNIYLLKWDCDLERFARTWTLSCPTFPVPAAKMPAGSQLAREFIFDFHGTNATEHIDDSMRAWWLEYKQHGNLDYKNRYSSRQNYYGWAN
ncbi:SCP-like protein, partial [Oesophagostomum dentatum]